MDGGNIYGETTIPRGLTGVTAIAVGNFHTVALGSYSYAPGATLKTNGSATFYARWAINTYSVTYDLNGGAGTIAARTKTYDVPLTLADSTGLTRSGYTFAGWNTSADGTGVS